jgi:hypothetical protein
MDNWSATSLNKDPLIEIHKKTTTNIIESIIHFPRFRKKTITNTIESIDECQILHMWTP